MDQNIDITVNEYVFQQLTESRKYGHEFRKASYSSLAELLEADKYDQLVEAEIKEDRVSNLNGYLEGLALGETHLIDYEDAMNSADIELIESNFKKIYNYTMQLKQDIEKEYYSRQGTKLDQKIVEHAHKEISNLLWELVEVRDGITDLYEEKRRSLVIFDMEDYEAKIEDEEMRKNMPELRQYWEGQFDQHINSGRKSLTKFGHITFEKIMEQNFRYVARKIHREKNLGSKSSVQQLDNNFRNLAKNKYYG